MSNRTLGSGGMSNGWLQSRFSKGDDADDNPGSGNLPANGITTDSLLYITTDTITDYVIQG